MQILKIIPLLIFLFLSNINASKYVCSEDNAYKDWLALKAVDINDDTVLVKYSDEISCKSQCKKIGSCLSATSKITNRLSSYATHYNLTTKNAIENTLKGKIISDFKVSTNSGTVVIPTSGLNGSAFIFPTGTPTVSKLTNTVYTSGTTSIKTHKGYEYKYLTESLYSGTSINSSVQTSITAKVVSTVNDANKIVVGFEVGGKKIIFTNEFTDKLEWPSNPNEKSSFFTSANGEYEFYLYNISGSPRVGVQHAGATYKFFDGVKNETLTLIYKEKIALPVYTVTFSIAGKTYRQNTDWISESTGSVHQKYQIGLTAIYTANGYSCPLFDSTTDIGGDVDSNVFSTTSLCANACYKQYGCSTWTENAKCKLTGFDKANPVSDYTGKTVFTKYTATWDCDTSSVVPGECIKYTKKVLENNTTFDTSSIGWKSKEFINHDEAITAVANMEQLLHVWSGWNGKCESGTKMDNDWMSDPMTILSFAGMAYTGALAGGYGTTLETASNAVDKAVTSAFDTTAAYTETAATMNDMTFSSAKAMSGNTGALSGLNEFLNTELIGATNYTTAVTNGKAIMATASLAMAALSEPTGDDIDMADQFMKAQFGGTNSSIAAVNYTQCMASIGLSFPNMVAYSMDDNKSTSQELLKPWKNVITLTDEQLAYLMKATSEKFVRASYLLKQDNGDSAQFIAITETAYIQAGQLICGTGKTSIGMNALNQLASQKNGGSSSKSGAMAEAAISTALMFLPPPANLIASIVFKIITSISSGNSCTDKKIAEQWGTQHVKTNKALLFNQCHLTGTKCSKKWFTGGCMLNGFYYCCYDQEMTRIFVEGIKAQLKRGWYMNVCDDIKLSDLKNISFRRCLDSETASEDKCFPQNSWKELNNAIKKQTTKGFDANSLTKSAIQSMPIGDDPWGPRKGD